MAATQGPATPERTTTSRKKDPVTKQLNHWIGGREVAPAGGQFDVCVNPATEEDITSVARGNSHDVDAAVSAAADATNEWRFLASAKRGRILSDIGRALRDRKEEFARLEIEDTGKPWRTAISEVENSADYFDFYASLVNLPQGDVLDINGATLHAYTKREPFGIVGVITPWNLPLNQTVRACAPALTAGNVVIVKPSQSTSQTTIALARLAKEMGLPDGVFSVVLGRGSETGSDIVQHPLVRKIAFTGSVGVGKTIGAVAAERIIPLTLELGGKSANIVFEDADFDFAVTETVRAFMLNSGQVCSAGTRLFVQRGIFDSFVKAVGNKVSGLRPVDDYGPSITQTQYQQVHEYFEVAKEEGATAIVGGSKDLPDGVTKGFYVQPTVYSNVRNDMRIAQEEIFGPVLVAQPFDTEAEVLALANDSNFGLVAGVFTGTIARALRMADRLEVGQVFINSWSTGAVQTPFGGNKQSGYGREKGIEALFHYSQVKSVTIALR